MPYNIKRKFRTVQRKNTKVSILNFLAIKPIHMLFDGTGLHSCGSNAPFDNKNNKNAKFDAYVI